MNKKINFKDDLILELCKGKKVLHIGATDFPYHLEKAKNNELLHQKLKKIVKNIKGIDINLKAINDLKRFGIHDIKNKSIYDKIQKTEVDYVILGDVLEHLSNPGIALENLKEIMNKNTKLIITTPNCYCYSNIANIFRKKEDVHIDHVFWPSKQTMIQLFKRYGFKITYFDYVNFGSYEDIKTLKGKIFYKLILKNLKKIRSTLFFILKRK